MSKKKLSLTDEYTELMNVFQRTFDIPDEDLNPYQDAVQSIFIFVGQVDNGGFIQFFQNTQDEYFERLLRAFELIQDKKTLEILQEAIEIYRRNEDKNQELAYNEGDMDKLEALDNIFYELEEDRDKILLDFYHENIEKLR